MGEKCPTLHHALRNLLSTYLAASGKPAFCIRSQSRLNRCVLISCAEKSRGLRKKMLTQQLRQMERDGLVIRTFYAEVPARVEYTLSALGETLVPIFVELCGWSGTHSEIVEEARKRYDIKIEDGNLPLKSRIS